MPRQIQGSQTDFSYGEVDPDLKRADGHPARKAGLRQMSNARIHNSGTIQNRSGRSALFPASTSSRIEKITMSAGNEYELAFGAGEIRIFNSAGAQVSLFAGLPWTALNVNQIVYGVMDQQVFVNFGHAMRPRVMTLTAGVWSIANYTELVTGAGQKRTPFYRLSPQNITMKPSGRTGAITVEFSGAIVVAGMVGTRMRFCNRQILLGAVIDGNHINATVIEPLPPSQTITLTGTTGDFAVGDVVLGNSSGAKGIVTASPTTQYLAISTFTPPFVGAAVTGVTSGATGVITLVDPQGFGANYILVVALSTATAFIAGETITWSGGSFVPTGASGVNMIVQLLQNNGFTRVFLASEVIAGPSGSGTSSAVVTGVPQAVGIWDEEVMNDFRGYPAACFVDQFRLGFCNFSSVPGGISWSAINSPTDIMVDASTPLGGMFELAPNKVQVYYVVPGPEGSEFVFCDRRVYYIPISVTNPLKSGSVAFNLLTGDGAAQVQPRLAQEAIVYVNAGGNSIMAIIATGAFLRPFNTKGLSDFHAHLFNDVKCIACPGADSTFNERYVYALNGDGSIVVGKYSAGTLVSNEPVIGWGPWSGSGIVKWISAWQQDVLFTTSYFGATICEALDDTVYMDAALFVNALPAPFTAPVGKGPLWWIPSQTVFLMDQATRPMGTYQIDANGNIIPQSMGGENLLAASLVAGQIWTGTAEPFAPDAPSGADQHQRMNERAFSYFAAWVIQSTGLTIAGLFSDRQTATTPPLGTVMGTEVFPAYNMGEDATLPPIQRETVYFYAPVGTTYDPRAAILWDGPGPLQILEIAMEVSI